MKTLDELRLMPPAQLKGIAQSLGVEPPKLDYRKAENKEKLVMLVYDVQQPEARADEKQDNTVKIDDIEPAASLSIDEKIALMEEAWGAKLEPVDETEEGATIFAVVDLVEDEEITRGTFLSLWDEYAQNPEAATQDVPLSEEPEDPAAVPEVTTGNPAEIEKSLNPLRRAGLKFEINGGAVKLEYGSKVMTTTVNQPLHRIVRVAETLCRIV